LICDDEKIRNCHIKFDHFVDNSELQCLIKALNKKLVGVCADEITLQVIMNVEEELGVYSYDSKEVLKSIFNTLKLTDDEEIHLGGITKLLSYPEFYNVTKAKSVIETLEKKKDFVGGLINNMEDDVAVYFGDENESTALVPDSSLVFVPIKHGGKTLGGIGVIGPKRMDYKKVISALHQLADTIDTKRLTLGEGSDE
jgi:heat-inducible transcriptional repressor